jgi:type IV pilus assembly protein PilN
MRLDINLASQPYEDAREFWMRWGTALAVAGVFTLVLLAWTTAGWFNARRDHSRIAEFQAQIDQRNRTRQQAEAFMNRPENRIIRDESRLINGLIERKAFSWTRVLENLERVMPPHVHLVSIHPQLAEDNQLALKMTVAGDSRDRAIELPRRMEETRRFSQTHIDGEDHLINAGDNIQLEMSAIYIPGPETAQPQPDAEKPDKPLTVKPASKAIAKPLGVEPNGRRKKP